MLYALEHMWGGEIFVPKIPSYRITDVAEAVCPGCAREIVGIRPGEKLHEEMITETDALSTVEFDDYFVILPSMPLWDVERVHRRRRRASRVDRASATAAGEHRVADRRADARPDPRARRSSGSRPERLP